MTDRSLPTQIIKLSPRQTQNAWVDATFEIMKWHLDNFERFYGLSRPSAKIYSFPTRQHGKP
jgi:hypothetical protein